MISPFMQENNLGRSRTNGETGLCFDDLHSPDFLKSVWYRNCCLQLNKSLRRDFGDSVYSSCVVLQEYDMRNQVLCEVVCISILSIVQMHTGNRSAAVGLEASHEQFSQDSTNLKTDMP